MKEYDSLDPISRMNGEIYIKELEAKLGRKVTFDDLCTIAEQTTELPKKPNALWKLAKGFAILTSKLILLDDLMDRNKK